MQAAAEFGIKAERRDVGTCAAVVGRRRKCSGSGGRMKRVSKHAAQGDPGGTIAPALLSKKSEPGRGERRNKSERSQIDSQASMGHATARTLERVAAAIGRVGAPAPVVVDAAGGLRGW